MKATKATIKEKRIFKNEDRLRDICNVIKHNNIHSIEVPGEGERQKEAENLFEEIIAESFPELENETDIQGPGGTESP